MLSLRDILKLEEVSAGRLKGVSKINLYPHDRFEVEGKIYRINKITASFQFEAVEINNT